MPLTYDANLEASQSSARGGSGSSVAFVHPDASSGCCEGSALHSEFTSELHTGSFEQAQDACKEGRRLYFHDKGEGIPLVTQGIWQVHRGVVQLSKLHPSGDELLLGWAKPSVFFGTWLTCVESYQAKALSNVYLRLYSLEEIEATPHLSFTVLLGVVRRAKQSEALLAIAGLRRVEERLQELLLLLQQELGEPATEGTRIAVRFTHQNIANAIGTTRVTVTRLLGEFQRQGLIAFDGARHIILLEKNSK